MANRMRHLQQWLAAALAACGAVAVLTPLGLAADEQSQGPAPWIRVTSKASLIHLGSLDSFDITQQGTKAAELVFDCVANRRLESAREARLMYERLIPAENFGGEYTALEWLCEYFLSSDQVQQRLLSDPVVAAWFKHLSGHDFELLKEYLKQKYHLLEWKDRKTPKGTSQYRFLEDFILFNNPRRERWEKTSMILDVLALEEGAVVADIGCGPGYYTFKFAEMVGESGFIYAFDNNRRHVEYLSGLVRQRGLSNVQVTETSFPSRQESGRKADVAFLCSLYHNIYAESDWDQRDAFLGGIKDLLKPDGRLVLVDNALVEDATLPYHGPYIAKELIIHQFWYHGFRLVETHQFIPQRYILVFEKQPGSEPPATPVPGHIPTDCIPVLSKASLVRTSVSSSSPGFTPRGRKAARVFLSALETKDPEAARTALNTFKALVPQERFGDEYTAFEWFCDWLLASPTEKQDLLSNWFEREYFGYLAGNDFEILKAYVRYKYSLDEVLDEEDANRTGKPIDPARRGASVPNVPESSGLTLSQISQWGEFIALNNPRRKDWEKTGRVLEFMGIRSGDCIADVGCGPGYYTFKFAERVGPEGLVYAVETKKGHLRYVDALCGRHGVTNVRTVLTRDNNINLSANSVDVVYLCSLYHYAYIHSMEYVKDGFVESIKRALRKDGRLVIADNHVLEGTEHVPYYGPRIAKELVISQLRHYGFRLVDQAEFIPQRYVLVFKLD